MTDVLENQKASRERLEAPGEYAGYKVLDPEGHKIGCVLELFVNLHDEPEYVRVKLGLFGLRTVMIPVEIVTVDETRRALVLR
ncbi:MAG: hypothetical protein CYG60_07570 [Actinobacteria bacterium]|nr:MAG: hypothetical protein CYG60_07570 [Actinomycetota bacterium]